MKARTYEMAQAQDRPGANIAELHFTDGRVVQISTDPNEDGTVLLRAWPPGGTAEYGGSNLTDLSLTFKVTADATTIESLNYDRRYTGSRQVS